MILAVSCYVCTSVIKALPMRLEKRRPFSLALPCCQSAGSLEPCTTFLIISSLVGSGGGLRISSTWSPCCVA